MLTTNNDAFFHFWLSENLLIYQGVWKYEDRCLQNFLPLFVSLLTALIVQNCHILSGICIIFWKRRLGPNLKRFQYQIFTPMKIWEKQLLSKAKLGQKP